MAFQISYCPHRVAVADWSAVQTTQFSQPVVFTGDKRDLEKLDECNEALQKEKAEKQAAEAAEREEAEKQAAEEEAERGRHPLDSKVNS